MKNLCLCFQVHHPFHQRTYRFLEVGKSHDYYDFQRIEREIQEAANKYYLPTNEFLLQLIQQSAGKLKILFYISGTTLDQFLMYSPETISSFKNLADTGLVGFAGGTRSHSIASLTKTDSEFQQQVKENRQRLNYYFGQFPQIFINTDLLFSNHICQQIAEAGYEAVLVNGSKKILQWRSPNYLYESQGDDNTSIFFRNETISSQFSNLLSNSNNQKTKKKLRQFIKSLEAYEPEEPQIFIYCNYLSSVGGELATKQIVLKQFISEIIQNELFQFNLPDDMHSLYGPIAEIGSDSPCCWVEHFSDLYYPGNSLQEEAIRKLFKLEKKVRDINDHNLKMDWLYLQTADHFHLMDENHPSYQNHSNDQVLFKSKYDAYINYMNILEDFRQRIKEEKLHRTDRLKTNRVNKSISKGSVQDEIRQ